MRNRDRDRDRDRERDRDRDRQTADRVTGIMKRNKIVNLYIYIYKSTKK